MIIDFSRTKIAILAVISNDNKVISSPDLQRVDLTEDHVVIMDQQTYELLGSKPLVKRFSIVLSTDWNFKEPIGYPTEDGTDIKVVRSVDLALESAQYYNDNNLEVFVIGDGKLYQEIIKYCYRLYITRIFKNIESDTTFPTIDPWSWKMVWCGEKQCLPDYDYEYQIWNVNYD
jgi:dihydrofolate reductase